MKKIFMYTFSFVKKEKLMFKFWVSLVISVINAILSIVIPLIIGEFIDLLVSNVDFSISIKYITLIFIIGLLGVGLSYCYQIISTKLFYKLEFSIIKHNISHLQKTPYEIFRNKFVPAQLTQQLFSDCKNIVSFVSNYFMQMIINLCSLLFLILSIFRINKHIFIIISIFIPVFFLGYIYSRKKLYDSSFVTKEANAQLYKNVHEHLESTKQIKLHSLFSYSDHILDENFSTFLKKILKNIKINQYVSVYSNLISILTLMCVLLCSMYDIHNSSMTIGNMTIINTYFAKIISLINFYLSYGRAYQNTKGSFNRLISFKKIPVESNGLYQISSIQNVSFKNIKFRYPDSKNYLNFPENFYQFKKGNLYLFKGINGSGKTTFCDILIGILTPYKGKIEYNNININLVDMYNLRKEKISVLSQNNIVFTNTVRQYLSEATDVNTLWEKISNQNLHIFWESQHEFNILLEKRYFELSKGEQQKIRLIKVLLKKADLYILDEPETNLDNESIKIFSTILNTIKKNSMIILISHNNDMQEIADQIIIF